MNDPILANPGTVKNISGARDDDDSPGDDDDEDGRTPMPKEKRRGGSSEDHDVHLMLKGVVRDMPVVGVMTHAPPHGSIRLRHEYVDMPRRPSLEVHDSVMVYVAPGTSSARAALDCRIRDNVGAFHPVETKSWSMYTPEL